MGLIISGKKTDGLLQKKEHQIKTLESSLKKELLKVKSNIVRGVAVFVSETEPVNPQINDIWIKI